jgi:hypothetical protein
MIHSLNQNKKTIFNLLYINYKLIIIMKKNVYYIKSTKNNFPEAITIGFQKALSICDQKGYSNIKLIVPNLDLLDSPPNFISEAIDSLFPEKGIDITKQLKKTRCFSIPGSPSKGITTGVNLLLSNNNLSFDNNKTVIILLYASYESFKKVQSSLFCTEIDLVAIIQFESSKLDELISASKGINISRTPDQNLICYTNSFEQNINDILSRLKGINITDVASHTPTRKLMKSVINELENNNIKVSYLDFLAFLINDVNFKLAESVKLLNCRHNYFEQ